MDLTERPIRNGQDHFSPTYPQEALPPAICRLQRRFRARERVLRFEKLETYMVTDGMLCRYTLTSDGRRQFNALLLPGDVIGLESAFNLRCTDTVLALTPAVCRMLGPTELFELPLSRLIREALERQTILAGQWMLNLGTRPAPQRLAYFLHETLTRMDTLGHGADGCHHLPLTQVELADILALTPVHVNRCLAFLKSAGLANFHRGRLQVRDAVALGRFADSEGNWDA